MWWWQGIEHPTCTIKEVVMTKRKIDQLVQQAWEDFKFAWPIHEGPGPGVVEFKKAVQKMACKIVEVK